MLHFNHVPGIAWHYHYAKNSADSAYTSVRTGDMLTLYAVIKQLEDELAEILEPAIIRR